MITQDDAVTVAPSARDLCASRRDVMRVLAAVGVGTVATGVLVACGAGDETSGQGTSGGAAGKSAGGTVPVADVPIGGARVVSSGGARYVVAQPEEGSFVAFSAACTHQGTPVTVEDGLTLYCANHGSEFDAATGDAVTGPATSPLAPAEVTVDGDQLVLA